MKKTILSLLVALMATTGATAQSPTTSGITWNVASNSGTFLMPAYDVEVSTELWYKVDEEKTAVDGDVKDILILNGSGTLVHPIEAGDMKGFRGYFLMHEAASLARAFRIDFGEGETTGIQPIRMENGTAPAEGTYDLSGRRIQGQPTHKGVYIQNGKKVVIK